jgi:hypothetical protein
VTGGNIAIGVNLDLDGGDIISGGTFIVNGETVITNGKVV